MGYRVDIRDNNGDLKKIDLSKLQGYLKSVVQEATGESMSRVVTHTSATQSSREKMEQLRQINQ